MECVASVPVCQYMVSHFVFGSVCLWWRLIHPLFNVSLLFLLHSIVEIWSYLQWYHMMGWDIWFIIKNDVEGTFSQSVPVYPHSPCFCCHLCHLCQNNLKWKHIHFCEKSRSSRISFLFLWLRVSLENSPVLKCVSSVSFL